jgi:hypothetical protein
VRHDDGFNGLIGCGSDTHNVPTRPVLERNGALGNGYATSACAQRDRLGALHQVFSFDVSGRENGSTSQIACSDRVLEVVWIDAISRSLSNGPHLD